MWYGRRRMEDGVDDLGEKEMLLACLSRRRCFGRNYLLPVLSLFKDRVLFCIQHDEDNEKA